MGQDRIHKFPPIHTNRIGKDDLWAVGNVGAPVSPMSIFNTNAAREDECFCVGVKCRNQPVADGKPAVIFFLFILLAFENPNQYHSPRF